MLDASDVEARPAGAGRFVTLTPPAALAATRIGLGACQPAVFTDRDHARCVAAGRRTVREFDFAAAGSRLPESAKVVGRQIAWQLAVLSHRLARSLPRARFNVRAADAHWIETDDRAIGAQVLLPRILEWGLQHRSSTAPVPWPWAYRRLALAHARLRSRPGPCVVAPGRTLKLGFHRDLAAVGARTVGVRVALGGVREYIRTLRDLLAGADDVGIGALPADDARLNQWLDAMRGIGESFSDPLLNAAWRSYQPYVAPRLAALGGVLRDAPRLMGALNARLAVCYEANSAPACALLEAAGASGREAVVVNHNSHPRRGAAIGDAVLGFFFEQRTANPVVSVSAHWSPDWVRWDPTGGRVRHLPYRYPYPAPARPGKRFRILHAGNYQNWSDFIPWVAETSQEYVDGLAALASAMRALPEADLVIRVRSKSEVSPEIVRELIAAPANVSVCGTERDFLEQMAECDVLVSYFSTTVEQALQMGKPVLLWGKTGRFCQFEPSWDPPGIRRHAVYAARDVDALPTMLRAIRDAHVNPLSAQETRPYRNEPGHPEPGAVAARMLAGDVRPAAPLPAAARTAFAGGEWSLIGGDGRGWPANEFYKVRGLAWHAGHLYASVSGPNTDGPRGEVWGWDGQAWQLQAGGWNARESFVEHLFSHGGFLYAAERSGIWRLDGGRWLRTNDGLTVPGRSGPYAFAGWRGVLAASYWGAPAVAVQQGGDWVALPQPAWGDGVRTVYCLQDYGGLLYAGTGTGKFTGRGAAVWRFDGQGWEKIGGEGVRGSWRQTGIPFILSLNVHGGMLVATLSRPPGTPRQVANLWAFDGAQWFPIGAGKVPQLMAESVIMNDTAVYRGNLVAATGDGAHRRAEVWELERGQEWRAVGGRIFGALKTGWIYKLCVGGEALFAATAGRRGAARVFRFGP